MSRTLPSLRSPSIRDSALDAMRNALLEGNFQPGESLSEPALAAQMGVSRGPVREALLMLAQEGLVIHNANRGFSVLTLGPNERHDMVKVRIPLEALALELAKSRATEEDLAKMAAATSRMAENYSSDIRTSAREDLAFHETLWDLSGNACLIIALKRVVVPFFLYTIMYKSTSENLDPAILEDQHRTYLNYLQGKTDLTADECVRLHLRMY